MTQNQVLIVATSPIPPLARAMFGQLGELALGDLDDRRLLSRAGVLVVRSEYVDGSVLDLAPRLRAIARTGVGLDKIDLEAATQRGIPVLYAPDAGTAAVAEGTLALIMAASKRLGELRAVIIEGRWHDRYEYEPRDLAGATLGIVGLGRIGSAVARLAQAIGMRVIAHEPWPDGSRLDSASIPLLDLDPLFGESDVVSLHCSLNESTRGLITRDLLSRTKPGAVLVNASRGGIILDDGLLVEALERGWLSGIGLDVFASEPPPADSPLLNDRRVVCTPHTVGLTQAWNNRVFGGLTDDLRRLFAGENPQNIANPEVLRVNAECTEA